MTPPREPARDSARQGVVSQGVVSPSVVSLRPDSASDSLVVGPLARRAALAESISLDAALDLARELGSVMSTGGGSIGDEWEALATLAAVDLETARAIEPHLDATSILLEAGESAPTGFGPETAWGVFAAEGPGTRLTATLDSTFGDTFGDAAVHGGAGWTLDGVKPWCSLADRLDAALVTAWVDDEHRALFAVSLGDGGVESDSSTWHARGLAGIPSGPVRFSDVPAQPIGAPEWYLDRPGFAWGGIGVAACWYGGAVGIARRVWQHAEQRPESAQLDTHLGAIDEVLEAAREALLGAAIAIERDTVPRGDESLLAARVRGIVVRACEELIWRAGHAMGPTPLALDADHAQRVADLTLYIRQHHAESDQQALGRQLRARAIVPW